MTIVDCVVVFGVDGCVVEISAVIEILSNKNSASDKKFKYYILSLQSDNDIVFEIFDQGRLISI